eukprot:Rhum_TRINITY_DN2273_c0_g2::Rhum_TRINITY_DN2273_c0_g2_i1::g.6595::m.6595
MFARLQRNVVPRLGRQVRGYGGEFTGPRRRGEQALFTKGKATEVLGINSNVTKITVENVQRAYERRMEQAEQDAQHGDMGTMFELKAAYSLWMEELQGRQVLQMDLHKRSTQAQATVKEDLTDLMMSRGLKLFSACVTYLMCFFGVYMVYVLVEQRRTKQEFDVLRDRATKLDSDKVRDYFDNMIAELSHTPDKSKPQS